MEFEFDIHKIFLEPISKLDHTLIPQRRPLISSSEAQRQITTVLDVIGKASAKAQRLPAPITSASRMQTNQHHLYILKDCTAKTAGRGVVIGFLKVGYKKLFVLDHAGSHIEAEPLCILDFYIHESLQRNGHGKELFSYMLRTEQVEPQHLAIDRPSEKFLSFLRKHYNLRSTIPQVNNFVVFEGFFRDRKVLKHEEGLPWPFSQSPSSLNRSGSLGSSPTRACSRPIPGEDDFVKSLRNCRPHSLQRAASGEQEDPSQRRRTSDMNLSRGLMAQRNCYSRYTCPSPPLLPRAPPTVDTKEEQKEAAKGGNRGAVGGAPQNVHFQPNSNPQSKIPSSLQPPGGLGSPLKGQELTGPGSPDDTMAPWLEKPSWTVLGTVMNAQWVKRKQEMRGTRPW
ncbi:alpha-tubulin N-acetyltransferase 1 isoform X2 [Hyla sarda]|uniref:alpha-tubulin N-acetyltransferase 1 isoform X2 n=1 Tax=Hyla sarda TaxID=327740 RepID=UPI0024C2237B|nr:alpha-tubulin N-acetyltransferase 1 isoform X2 [Hyla sarda]